MSSISLIANLSVQVIQKIEIELNDYILSKSIDEITKMPSLNNILKLLNLFITIHEKADLEHNFDFSVNAEATKCHHGSSHHTNTTKDENTHTTGYLYLFEILYYQMKSNDDNSLLDAITKALWHYLALLIKSFKKSLLAPECQKQSAEDSAFNILSQIWNIISQNRMYFRLEHEDISYYFFEFLKAFFSFKSSVLYPDKELFDSFLSWFCQNLNESYKLKNTGHMLISTLDVLTVILSNADFMALSLIEEYNFIHGLLQSLGWIAFSNKKDMCYSVTDESDVLSDDYFGNSSSTLTKDTCHDFLLNTIEHYKFLSSELVVCDNNKDFDIEEDEERPLKSAALYIDKKTNYRNNKGNLINKRHFYAKLKIEETSIDIEYENKRNTIPLIMTVESKIDKSRNPSWDMLPGPRDKRDTTIEIPKLNLNFITEPPYPDLKIQSQTTI